MTIASELPAIDRAETPDAPAPRPASAARRGRWTLARLLQWVAVIALTSIAIVAGVELRRAAFISTAPVRFVGDIHNAFAQGSVIYRTAQQDSDAGTARQAPSLRDVLAAYLKRYDAVAAAGRNGHYSLDYPPVRLLIMTLWVYHVRTQRPDAQSWADADLWPLLGFNTVMAGLAAVAAFLLVRHWRAVRDPRRPAPIWVPFGCALLVWFNLAVLVNAHMWPQWDVWLVTSYLWVIYFCSRGWWFTAGMAVAVGCMFKGQLLIGAPVLILWPLLRGQWMAVVRQLVGFAFGMAALTSVWLFGGASHGWWMAGLALATAGVLVVRAMARRGATLPISRPWARLAVTAAGIAAVMMLVLLGWWRSDDPIDLTWGVLLALAMLLPAVFVRQVPLGVWAAGIIAAALLLGGLLFGGSFNWLKVGYAHGFDNHQGMYIGHAYNLASLMQDSYGWQLYDRIEWLGGMEVKTALRNFFALITLVIGAAAALQSRRNSTRMLVVLTAPWLLMFATAPQMHERYLLYAAAVSAIAAGYNFGFCLLHLFLSVVSAALMWRQQRGTREFWPELHTAIMGFTPGMAWAILLASLIVLYVSLAVSRRDRPDHALTPSRV